jgi:hypothetical protein
MNTLLLITSLAVAGGVALWLVHWVVSECSLPPVARLTSRWLERTRDHVVPDLTPSPTGSAPPARLHKEDEAVKRLFHGCPCSEVILATYGPALGISRGEAFEFCLKYAKELNLPQACAAVTGACIALGTRCTRAQTPGPPTSAAVAASLQEFAARFCARDGSVYCRQLCPATTSTGSASSKTAQPEWVPQVCPKLIHDAAEILEQMLN